MKNINFFIIKKKTIGLIHKFYLIQLKNFKKYLANTKTKSEVRGGGKKPWKQKGTGKARAGSIRSPLWVGGGVSFGPKTHICFKKLNKKEQKVSLLTSFFLKESNFYILSHFILNRLHFKKTNNILQLLNFYKINKNTKILFILNKANKLFLFNLKNIKNIKINLISTLNIFDILTADKIFLSLETFSYLNFFYRKNYA